ncbi:MAG: acyl carrier protein [Marinomonas colpomeniae]
MQNKIKEIMSDIFKIDVDSINDETVIGNVEKWDSLGHMNLVAALEDEFDIVLDDEDIEIIISYPNICKIVKTNL